MKLGLRRISFQSRLLLAFVLLIVLTLTASYLFVNQWTGKAFREFASGRYSQQDRYIALYVGALYKQLGAMDLVIEQLEQLPPNVTPPIVIVGPDSQIAFTPDPRGIQFGRRLSSSMLDLGVTLTTTDEEVWTLLPSRFLAGQEIEDAYLARSRRSIVFAGLIGGLAAVALAILLIRQLTRPLRKLEAAARRISEGSFGDVVDVQSSDELGRLAGSFNDMSASLASSEHAKKQMIADISHELRTPITAIRTTLESLRDGLMEPTQEALTALHDRILLTTRLVNDLHQLALADAGRLSMHATPSDLATMLETILETIGVQIEDEELSLVTEIPSNLSPVLADRQRIEQVLLNLLANAIRHTPSGGVLTVRAEQLQDSVRISVCDSGPGLDPGEVEHVFDRFYRADESRTLDAGAGLGLSIAKALVEAHGGRIWARNTAQGGACFNFTLPLAT